MIISIKVSTVVHIEQRLGSVCRLGSLADNKIGAGSIGTHVVYVYVHHRYPSMPPLQEEMGLQGSSCRERWNSLHVGYHVVYMRYPYMPTEGNDTVVESMP